MEKLKIHQLREDLWALDEIGKTVMYVVNGTESALLVDTGFGLSDLKKVVTDLCGEKDIIVVNSHGHPDHNGGNNQFEYVYVGRFDEPFSHDLVDEEEKIRTAKGFFTQFPGYDEETWMKEWNPGPAEDVIPLSEGDIIDLGNHQFEVIEIPGHSLGSIALFDQQTGWLFTGDTMLTWEVWGQLATSTALSVYGDSCRKLAAIKEMVTTVLPAHWVPKTAEGMSPYELPVEVLDVYADGIDAILAGESELEDYLFGFLDPEHPQMMKCARFSIGGIAFDPKRIG